MGLLRATPLLLVLALAGCTLALPGGKTDKPAPLAAEAIEVTKLDAPKGAAPDAAKPAKATGPTQPDPAPPEPAKPEPAAQAADPEAEAEPTTKAEAEAETPPEAAEPLSPAALACKKKGGRYVKTGSGDLRACVKLTGEEGKSCTRETDCKGACLARSGTCAPVTPLFGCNEILQADGRRVTLCLD